MNMLVLEKQYYSSLLGALALPSLPISPHNHGDMKIELRLDNSAKEGLFGYRLASNLCSSSDGPKLSSSESDILFINVVDKKCSVKESMLAKKGSNKNKNMKAE